MALAGLVIGSCACGSQQRAAAPGPALPATPGEAAPVPAAPQPPVAVVARDAPFPWLVDGPLLLVDEVDASFWSDTSDDQARARYVVPEPSSEDHGRRDILHGGGARWYIERSFERGDPYADLVGRIVAIQGGRSSCRVRVTKVAPIVDLALAVKCAGHAPGDDDDEAWRTSDRIAQLAGLRPSVDAYDVAMATWAAHMGRIEDARLSDDPKALADAEASAPGPEPELDPDTAALYDDHVRSLSGRGAPRIAARYEVLDHATCPADALLATAPEAPVTILTQRPATPAEANLVIKRLRGDEAWATMQEGYVRYLRSQGAVLDAKAEADLAAGRGAFGSWDRSPAWSGAPDARALRGHQTTYTVSAWMDARDHVVVWTIVGGNGAGDIGRAWCAFDAGGAQAPGERLAFSAREAPSGVADIDGDGSWDYRTRQSWIADPSILDERILIADHTGLGGDPCGADRAP